MEATYVPRHVWMHEKPAEGDPESSHSQDLVIIKREEIWGKEKRSLSFLMEGRKKNSKY